MMKLSKALFLSATFAKACNAERILEGDIHSCACEAIEFEFEINCEAIDTMMESMTFLKSNNCAAVCTEDEAPDCFRHYLIVQSHHDFCPEEGIPEEIEDGFHDFDTACTACAIDRKATEGAEDCPVGTCDKGPGDDAYAALILNDCGKDCSSDECKDLYFTLRYQHDKCEHDTISSASEEGMHDLEVPCGIHKCNYDGVDNNLVCVDDHDDHDHGDDHGDDHDEETDIAREMGDGASDAATAGLTGAASFFAGVLYFMA
ncbi:hypothetical protein QTG54_011701 [Skeletonema marinoi]|uniref:Uncharacterized protein n=1 Tax=Skeletonema marinoi TaxID=267567 RepID=A0AAD9D951_9STRA|nr:hypothetical protein QTG54_011701 [Skeletonema marinoi]